MSKFVLKNDPQQEVRIGDSITATRKSESGILTITRTITEDVLNELIKSGVVIKVDSENGEEEMNIFHVIAHLAKRLGWKPENLKKYIENLYSISPVAVYQILLKECAIMIDSNYKNHITEVHKVYAVSIVDGEVFEIEQDSCGNYTNVALFRTPTEARLAKKVLMLIEADIF